MLQSTVSAPSPIAPFLSRRVSMRVAASLPVELVITDPPGTKVCAHSRDIGVGGLCVQTAEEIDAKTVGAVQMTLGRRDLEINVKARWHSPVLPTDGPLIGFEFEFESVDATSEAVLWSFIQERGRELATFLRGCPGLEYLAFENAFELALTTRLRRLQVGQVVYGPDEDSPDSNSIFALFRGSVRLEQRTDEGSRKPIAYVKSGEIFGGLPVVASCTPFEHAVAMEESTVVEFSGYSVDYLLGAKPPLAVALMRATSFHWMLRFAEIIDRLPAP